jgi:hypothetical protein
MTRQSPPLVAEDHLRQGATLARNDTFAESYPRWACDVANGNAISATGVAHATAIPLQAGDVVTSITFVTGATAAATPTAGFVALYSSASTPALLAQSADFGSTARAANTAYTIPLASAVTITDAGLYYISISFTAGTVPTLRGLSTGNAVMAGAVITGMPVLAQSHGSSLGATAPATITSGTAVATPVYYIVR